MSAEIWIGTEPKGYEERLLRDLHRGLSQAPDTHVLLSNFTVGGREIDLLTLKEGAIFLCECKWVNGPVRGGINGDWQVQADDGPRPVNACRENPYQQMLRSFYGLANWLEGHKTRFLSKGKAERLVFRPNRKTGSNGAQRVRIRSLLVFYPDLDPASELELDWKVVPLGYPALMPYMVEEQTARADLTLEEMRALAQALGLSPWIGAPTVAQEGPLYPAPLPLAAVMSQAVGTCWHYLCLVMVNSLMRRLQRRRRLLRAGRSTLPMPTLTQPALAAGQEYGG